MTGHGGDVILKTAAVFNPTLAIFAKSPVPGQVKTRLCPPLTWETAACLQRAFFADTVTNAVRAGLRPTIYFDGSRPLLENALTESVNWQAQGDGDLGARLARVPAPCIILGADSPQLPSQVLRDAADALETHDMALGPAEDGGYYLIGLRAPAPFLFENIAWSSDTVLAQTMAQSVSHGLSSLLLPLSYDIDTGNDLRRLADELLTLSPAVCPATRALLKSLNL